MNRNSEQSKNRLYSLRSKIHRCLQLKAEKQGTGKIETTHKQAEEELQESEGITNNWFGTTLLNTNYGAWGKENVMGHL